MRDDDIKDDDEGIPDIDAALEEVPADDDEDGAPIPLSDVKKGDSDLIDDDDLEDDEEDGEADFLDEFEEESY